MDVREHSIPGDRSERARALALAGEVLENGAQLAEQGAGLKREVDELLALLGRTERAIVMADRALRVAQPPVNGKLGIRWWRTHGGATLRTPVLITWHRVRGGRWRARKLAQVRLDRISRDGTSKLCADNVYALARAAADLIRTYGWLCRELRDARRKLTRVNLAFNRIDRAEAVLLAQHQQVIEKLTRAGYDVDQRTRQMSERYLAD